jgi:hypothetical protein
MLLLMKKFETLLSFYRVPPLYRHTSKWGQGAQEKEHAPQAKSRGLPIRLAFMETEGQLCA